MGKVSLKLSPSIPPSARAMKFGSAGQMWCRTSGSCRTAKCMPSGIFLLVASLAARGKHLLKDKPTKERTTMENQIQTTDIPKWSALLVEAVNKPGTIMKAYSAFWNYSMGNQILAILQCQLRGIQPGPINTFPKWQTLAESSNAARRL